MYRYRILCVEAYFLSHDAFSFKVPFFSGGKREKQRERRRGEEIKPKPGGKQKWGRQEGKTMERFCDSSGTSRWFLLVKD
jgi:hypothetical protein